MRIIGLFLYLIIFIFSTFGFTSTRVKAAASTVEITTSSQNARIYHTPVFTSGPDSSIYITLVEEDPLTLDPTAPNNATGKLVVQQVYETLLLSPEHDPSLIAPQLAVALPQVSADGLTYTFTLREGISFHEGGALTAEDVAYSLQRGILQGGDDSAQYLLTEPLLGAGVRDISHLLFADDPNSEQWGNRAALQAADPARLVTACEAVQSRIRANGNTLTITLAQPWSSFPALLTGEWASVLDREWVMAQDGWDGSCNRWHLFYNMPSVENRLSHTMNGTGPFQFAERESDLNEAIVLTAYEDYWRTEAIAAAWADGPSGVAAFETVIYQVMPEGYESLVEQMVAGDADSASIAPEYSLESEYYEILSAQVAEECVYRLSTATYNCRDISWSTGPLRRFYGKPSTTHSALLYNWRIATEPNHHFLGSGQWDGAGIPATFFSDVHVRRGFAYCFDSAAYLEEYLHGEGIGADSQTGAQVTLYGVPLPYHITLCKEELVQAWGGEVARVGFRLQVPYNVEDDHARLILILLQNGLSEADPRYQLELVAVTPDAYNAYEAARQVPLLLMTETLESQQPYEWFSTFMVDRLAQWSAIPELLIAPLRAKLRATMALSNPAVRQHRYLVLDELDQKWAFALRLPIPTDVYYEQRWVVSPHGHTDYVYALRKE